MWASSSTKVARDSALIVASGYIDGRYRDRFPGRKAGGRAQSLEWPRFNAVDASGEGIAEDEVPVEVEHAVYEAALREVQAPGSLSPDFDATALVKRERVDVIETEYVVPTDATAARLVVSIIDDILSGLLVRKEARRTVSFLARA